MRHVMKLVVAAAGLLLVTGAARTERQLLLIPSSDATARTDADTAFGQYYMLTYRLPEGLPGERVEMAVLEIYLDVRAKSRDGYVNEAPVVQIYALTEPFAGTIGLDMLDPDTRAARPVARGEHRRVLMDITHIVQAHLAGRLSNNGLVLGSVVGSRDGDVRVVTGKFPGENVGRLWVYTRPNGVR